MSSLGDLVVNLVAQTRQFTGPMQSSMASLAQLGRSAGQLTSILGGLGGAFTVIGGARWGFSLAAAAEQSEIAFTTLLGSAREAKALLGQLSQFAESTPYESPEVIKASQQLLAFGVTAKDIVPTLTQLGDISSGVGQPIGEIAYLFGTAKTQGRLFSQDINQFTGRGIPIIGALAATLGVAEGQVKKLVEQGKVGFPQLQDALKYMTATGSQFGGMMDAQSRSVNGLMSAMSDKVGQTARLIAEELMQAFDLRGILNSSIAGLTTFQKFLSDHRETLRSVAAMVKQVGTAFGVMTVGAMTYAAAQRVATVSAIMFQAALNPAALVKIGISLGAAVAVVAAMDAGMQSVSASVVDVKSSIQQLGSAADQTKNSIAGIGQALGDAANPLEGLINRLQAWQNQPPRLGQIDLPRIFEGEQLFPAVSPLTAEVQTLYTALEQVRKSAGLLGQERFTAFADQIKNQIGHASGITSAIADAKLELAAMDRSSPDIFKAVQKFGLAGALPNQLRELEEYLRSIEKARQATEQFQQQIALRNRGADMITDLKDQIDVLKGTASQTEIALRQLVRDGMEPAVIETIRKLMEQRDALKQDAEKDPAQKALNGKQPDFAAALSKGSQGAVAAIQRGQFGANQLKTLEGLAKKQVDLQQKAIQATVQVASAITGMPPDLVAHFGA